MKTINDRWLEFRNQCYPHGMTLEQERQVWRAFWAGAFVTFNAITQCSEHPDNEAEFLLSKIQTEIEQAIQSHISTITSQ